MGQGHSHRAGRGIDEEVAVGALARNLLLSGLGVALLAALIGLVVWWPSGSDDVDREGAAAQFAAPGVTFPVGEITEVAPQCPGNGMPDGSGCSTITVEVPGNGTGGGDSTRETTVPVPREVLESGIGPGDRVELMRTPVPDGPAQYSYFATDRDGPLLLLAIIFLVVVVAIARWRGLFAVLGMAYGAVVIWWFVLPSLLEGAPGVGVALTGATVIMVVVLYTTHGFSLRTSTALAGTLIGAVLTAGIGQWALARTHLTGISDESGSFLSGFAPGLDFQSLLGCALVIAGLGVLNDVTITQASAVWELRATAPDVSRATLFASGMRIGRDHIASTIYTIVFAYVGTALLVLMLLQVYGRPLIDLISTEQLAEEIVFTLTTSIGLVLAVPITTGIAALVVGAARPRPAGDEPAGGAELRGL